MRKKLFNAALLLLLAGSMILVSGCKNEEENDNNEGDVSNTGELYYNPAKKISKIFLEREGYGKELYQTWSWEGNKLSKICYHEGDATIERRLCYSGNQVTKIQAYYNDVLVNGFEQQIEWSNNFPVKEIILNEDEYCVNEYQYDGDGQMVLFTSGYMDNGVMVDDDRVSLLYQNGNPYQIIYDGYGSEFYNYDTKPNPFWHCIYAELDEDGLFDYHDVLTPFSQNNRISRDNDTYVYTYNEAGWPTSVSFEFELKKYKFYYEYYD